MVQGALWEEEVMNPADWAPVRPMPMFDMTALRDWNGDQVTIINYDRRAWENPDPFTADEPDMTGVSE